MPTRRPTPRSVRNVRITIRAKPRSSQSRLTLLPDGTYTAHLQAGPVDGAANDELVRLVAKHFAVPRSAVTIATGATGRTKFVDVATPTQ